MFVSLLVWLCGFTAWGIPTHHKRVGGGWNDRIKWNRLSDGMRLAREQKKPMLAFIYQSKDGACKALKPLWVQSTEIEKLSSHFVMVNAGDHDEPSDKKFRPEGAVGGYYPRIIFLRSDGSRIDGIQGPSSSHSAYFSDAEQIVAAMGQALLAVGIDVDAEAKAKEAAAKKAREEEEAAYRASVPGMLESIFNIVDGDRNNALSHAEFSEFMKGTKGQVPTEAQYQHMCKLHATPNGLTYEKMSKVYASRSIDELRKVHDRLIASQSKGAEL
jgi:protein-disulfide reductase (glutathione)